MPEMIKVLETPPGKVEPYTLPPLSGEVLNMCTSKSVMRLVVTGKESAGAFALVGASGSEDVPIGFHYHHEAHDCFLCLKGKLNLWINNECRTLEPGDYASVPPKAIHQYQVLGEQTEFLGLIIPGGWEEFFRYIGEPYDGPLYPIHDSRSREDFFLPRILKAQELFDMVRVPTHPEIAPQPWKANNDDTLPGALEPYYLKNDLGKRYVVSGLVNKPLATRAESGGKFSIGRIEGSSAHKPGPLSSKFIKFDITHHAFQVEEGVVELVIHEQGMENKSRMTSGDVVYIPAGTAFKFDFGSRYAMFYAFSSMGGIIELLRDVGDEFGDPIPPEKATKWDARRLINTNLQKDLGYTLI